VRDIIDLLRYVANAFFFKVLKLSLTPLSYRVQFVNLIQDSWEILGNLPHGHALDSVGGSCRSYRSSLRYREHILVA